MPKPIFARKPFPYIKSPVQYDAGKMDQQLTRMVQSIPSTKSVIVTGDYELTTSDRWVSADTTAGDIAVTLPVDPSAVQNLEATITNVGANTATVVGTISGVASPTLAQWKSITLMSDGVRYVQTGGV